MIPDEKIKEFLFYGTVVLGLLMVLNLLYFIEFVWIQVILKVKEFLELRKQK